MRRFAIVFLGNMGVPYQEFDLKFPDTIRLKGVRLTGAADAGPLGDRSILEVMCSPIRLTAEVAAAKQLFRYG